MREGKVKREEGYRKERRGEERRGKARRGLVWVGTMKRQFNGNKHNILTTTHIHIHT